MDHLDGIGLKQIRLYIEEGESSDGEPFLGVLVTMGQFYYGMTDPELIVVRSDDRAFLKRVDHVYRVQRPYDLPDPMFNYDEAFEKDPNFWVDTWKEIRYRDASGEDLDDTGVSVSWYHPTRVRLM